MWKLHEYICLEKYFHKSIHILVFNNYFYKNKKSKLYFRNRVAILNNFLYQLLYQIEGSTSNPYVKFTTTNQHQINVAK
jgi:hypothetical protein